MTQRTRSQRQALGWALKDKQNLDRDQRQGQGLPGADLGTAWLGLGTRKTSFGEGGRILPPCFSLQTPMPLLETHLHPQHPCFGPGPHPLPPANLKEPPSWSSCLQSCSAVIHSLPAPRIFPKHRSTYVAALLLALSVDRCHTSFAVISSSFP